MISSHSIILFFSGVCLGMVLFRLIPMEVKALLKEFIKSYKGRAEAFVNQAKGIENTEKRVKLERLKYLGATENDYSFSNDERLLSCFYKKQWGELREQSLQKSWNYDFSSLEQYQFSVEENRQRLKGYLGKWHESTYEILDEEQVYPITEDIQVSHILFQSGIPCLVFDAYIVRPVQASEFRNFGVVALHGHDSNAEKLVGIGNEDYGRRMALRLARQGFTVIVPNVTSQRVTNNIISAHSQLYGYTLHGIMVQFIYSCVTFLQSRFPELKHFGVYGVSNGALLSLLSSALSPIFKFVLASGILQSLYDRVLSQRSYNNSLEYYFYFQGPLWMEFDIVQLATLSVPKLLLFEVGAEDHIVRDWEQKYSNIQAVYKKLGLSSRIDQISFWGKHEFAENYGIEALKRKIQSHPNLFQE
jgi:hypothetical protein